jgi:hypothetical protein
MSASPTVERETRDGVFIKRTSGHKYHVYLTGQDDTDPIENLPSVTKIAKVYDPGRGPALMGWAVKKALGYLSRKVMSNLPGSRQEFQRLLNSAKGAAARERNKAGDYGQKFHGLAEQLVINHVTGTSLATVYEEAGEDVAITSALQAVEQYLVQSVPVGSDVWTEAPILGMVDGELLYVGCADVVVWVRSNTPTIIDFKTGNYFYDETWIQMAGYADALRREDERVTEVKRVVIHVPKFGKGQVITRKRQPAKADDEAWKHTVHLHYYSVTDFGKNNVYHIGGDNE